MKENNKTLVWTLFERGRDYNQRLTPNQYNLVETNTEFFIGNQWLHLPNTEAMRSIPKPTFNILKRIASLFIASLTSSGISLRFEPLAYYDGSNIADPQHDASVIANALVSNLLDKFKFEYRVRDALFDGAQTGDYCAHFFFDPFALPYGGAFGLHTGEIQMELVDGINVMFGNPNDRRVETQPYILLLGRDTVENLKAEAEAFRKNKNILGKKVVIDADGIQPDAEYDLQAGVGGKVEISADDGTGKALYGLLYTKVTKEVDKIGADGLPEYEDELDADGNPVFEKGEDGNEILDFDGNPVPKRRPVRVMETTVYATKATKTGIVYENVDTGLSRYPIAWGNWEKQKNQYHGRALVTGLVPNQIFINSMFATAFRHLQLMAFPKTVFNADLISAWTNEIGQAIGVKGLQPGQSISQVAYNLQPAEMSNQIFALIDKAMEYTKECLGATDAQMGNVNPENTSALMVLQTNSEVPLENIRAGVLEWSEDCGLIILDMAGTYYGLRPIVVDKEFEEPVMGPGGVPMLDPMTGQMRTQTIVRRTVQEFDFSQFKHLHLNLRVDAGDTTYYSEIAMTQTLDNLRRDGTLDVIQYLERIPEKLIPKKQELIDELKGRIAKGEQANAAAGAAIPQPGSPMQGSTPNGSPVQGGPLSPDKAVQGLPTQAEAIFNSLPNIAKKTALAQGNARID
jgi:hypothetical protein